MRKFLANICQACIPNVCFLCIRPCVDPICLPCKRSLPWNNLSCQLCAFPLPQNKTLKTEERLCANCIKKPNLTCPISTAMLYVDPIRSLMQAFKFQNQPHWARLFANLIASFLYARQSLDKITAFPDALIAVPMHPTRLRERGYNQAMLLAQQLGSRLKIPLITPCKKVKLTPTQRALTGRERRCNLHGCFVADTSINQYHSIAIVDDVVTTGSTIHAVAHALRLQHPTIALQAWCLARAC